MPPHILMIDTDSNGVRIRGYVLEASGYSVQITTDPERAKVLLSDKPAAIVTSLHLKDRAGKALLPQLRAIAPNIPLIALTDTHHGGSADRTADRFVLKLDGPKALLTALEEVLREEPHHHSEFQSERVVFVDRDRRYIDATEKACELIGYRRTELLGMRIEDIAVPGHETVKRQFAEYVTGGAQEGTFELRHKDGHPIVVRFKAIVLPDGCMAAEWEPLEQSGQPASREKT